MYTSYELNLTQSRADWFIWYAKHGNNGNFNSVEDWWEEMLKYGLLVKKID